RLCRLHLHIAVEVLGFEVDVVEAQRAPDARREAFGAEGRVRTEDRRGNNGAREVLVRAAAVPLRVNGLVVVPEFESLHIQSVLRSPHDVLAPAAVSALEQVEGKREETERILLGELEAEACSRLLPQLDPPLLDAIS